MQKANLLGEVSSENPIYTTNIRHFPGGPRSPFPVPSSSAGSSRLWGLVGDIKLLQEADAYPYSLQLAAEETYCCRAGGFTHRAHITWSVIGYLWLLLSCSQTANCKLACHCLFVRCLNLTETVIHFPYSKLYPLCSILRST